MATIGEFRGRGGGDFGFERGGTILVLDRAAFERMNLPGGMTYSWCRKLGVEITETAQGKLTFDHGYKTGELKRSIGWSRTPAGSGVFVNVRASSSHAVYYHEGTRAHRILGQNGMKFFWVKEWRIAKFKPDESVNHPGFSGNPFLREAMEEVLIANGISL